MTKKRWSKNAQVPTDRDSLLLLLLLLLLVSRPVVTYAFLTFVQCVLKQCTSPTRGARLLEYVSRLGQTPLFKTCVPCRRNIHLYMSFLHIRFVLLGHFDNYRPVQAKRQFVTMHNSCCFSKTGALHVQQRVAPKSDTSGLIKCT